MRILWNLFKVILGLAIAIPLGIFALAATIGIVGALVGLAVVVLKFALAAFLVVGAVKVVGALLGSTRTEKVRELPAADPYYDAAMRELNSELGPMSR